MRTSAIYIVAFFLCIGQAFARIGIDESDSDKGESKAAESKPGATRPPERKPTEPQPEPLRLVLELRDGSRVIGEPSINTVKVQTSFAKFDLELKLIASIEFHENRETARISLTNGDNVQGTLLLDGFQMQTSFGKVSIPLSEIVRLSTQRGSALRGLVLHFAFDRDEGGTVSDRSGNGNHGKVEGARWVKDGVVGGAMSFDGQATIDLGDLPGVERQDSLSFGAWVYPTGQGLRGVMGKTLAGDEVFYMFTHIQSHTRSFRCCVVPVGRSEERYVDCGETLKLNSWHHLLGTYDGTQVKAYLNGQFVGSSPVFERKRTNDNHVRLAIGDTGYDRGWPFLGKIDEVMIFQRALTAEEIRLLYQTQKPAL